jgi:hypothetical protein
MRYFELYAPRYKELQTVYVINDHLTMTIDFSDHKPC